jgi:hypothetical protein
MTKLNRKWLASSLLILVMVPVLLSSTPSFQVSAGGCPNLCGPPGKGTPHNGAPHNGGGNVIHGYTSSMHSLYYTTHTYTSYNTYNTYTYTNTYTFNATN